MSAGFPALRAALGTPLRGPAVAAASLVLAAGPLLVTSTADATATATRPQATVGAVTPLSVRLTSMSRSTIPAKGAVVVTGLVANGSRETWTDVTLTPFASTTPITSRAELAEAARTDPATTVGVRLPDPDVTVAVGTLGPGEVVPFRIRVPREALAAVISGAGGVYWFGVHALGTDPDGARDAIADGRARTFLPLVPGKLARTATTRVSLVLPLRERARRAADGRLNGPARWVALTGDDGRLTRLAQLAESAGPVPVTWLVDPAVLDALEDLGRGNPALSLGGRRRIEPTPSPSTSPTPSSSSSPSESASDSPSPSPESSEGTEDRGKGSLDDDERARAQSVLTTFLGAVQDHPVLSLPYADVDAAALARRRPSLLRLAESLSAEKMEGRRLTAQSTVAPPGGQFDPTLLTRVPDGTLLLLGDSGAAGSDDQAGDPSGTLPTGQPVVLSDDLTSSGGPPPTPSYDALAMRQRVISDAALELATDAPRPIVVQLPATWDPGPTWREADLFGGLQKRWLDLAPLQAGSSTPYDARLPYDKDELAAEIRGANVEATRQLVGTASTVGHLLANANDVEDRLTGAALEASAYSARGNRALTIEQVDALDADVRRRLAKVRVTGTDPVTLSAQGGQLTVTLVNGLEQPITVGLRVRDAPGVRIRTPGAVDLAAGERRTIRMSVTSTSGLHQISLSPVTDEDQVVGTSFTFSLRTSQVGEVIWYVMAAGGALLLVMIVRRIVLRLRNRSWRVEDGAS